MRFCYVAASICAIAVLGLVGVLLHGGGRSAIPSFLRKMYPNTEARTLGTVFQGFSEVDPVLLSPFLGKTATLPTVLAPGMGDSCFNPGFSQLTTMVATRTSREAFCFGPGNDAATDPVNSFTKSMDEQVEHFAKKVKAKGELAAGFNAMGLSQGNLIIRAYIQRYNDPPVLNFISVHGPHAGVASVPRCDPTNNAILRELCDLLDYLLGDFVYTPAVQTSVAQSNYYRDPLKIKAYLKGCSFLPDILDHATAQYRSRFTSLKHLALIMAERDTMIFPKESEYFGAFADGGWRKVIPANQQPWYETIGLRELDAAGRISALSTPGDHLRFSQKDLNDWVDKFFM
jgi:palmitoyl-protein thioesterase